LTPSSSFCPHPEPQGKPQALREASKSLNDGGEALRLGSGEPQGSLNSLKKASDCLRIASGYGQAEPESTF